MTISNFSRITFLRNYEKKGPTIAMISGSFGENPHAVPQNKGDLSLFHFPSHCSETREIFTRVWSIGSWERGGG